MEPNPNMMDGALRVVATDGHGRILVKTRGSYFQFRAGQPLEPVAGTNDRDARIAWQRMRRDA